MSSLRIPVATYRLQFNCEFPLSSARALVPYLHRLGITDLYSSPLLQAQRGSAHGYDVTDPTRINPEFGGEEEFKALTGKLRQHDMGLLLDIVPNHMAASTENPWWLDVLRHGPESPYASYFDVDWQPSRPGLLNKVLLPILGAPYGKVLENQELSLTLDKDGFWICYYETRLPLSPGSHSRILEYRFESLGKTNNEEHQDVREPLADLINMFKGLPPRREEHTYINAFQRALDKLWQLYNNSSRLKSFIDETLRQLNGIKGEPQTFNALDRLLGEQVYRLAFWRVANQEINYRRFFNVSDKVSLHMEKDFVYRATHAKILELVEAGLVTGLRIDHIDGLYDPQEYLNRLQAPFSGKGQSPGFYIVAEKILGRDEELPADWPVYGTTGYDFLNVVNNLFVDRHEATTLDRIYDRLVGHEVDFDEVVYAQKRRVMAQLFAVEVRTLARHLHYLAEYDRHACDLTLPELEKALTEVIACFPVYRTYIRDFQVNPRDRKYIERAIEEAVRECPDAGPACDFLRRVLLLDFPGYLTAGQQQAWLGFVMRWQQFTGPIMAKGFEDTALYVYNQLVSLNEVGGDPRDTGIPVAEFHLRNRARQELMPHTLNATSTHDTKRSEDVRARINVISEIPLLWADRLKKWRSWNQSKKLVLNGQPVPDGNTELLIYQTLIGAWPLEEKEVPEFKERLKDYLVKSAREAKVYTSWLHANTDYENALVDFMMSILQPAGENRFFQDFIVFQRAIAYYGAWGSLAQVLLKTTSPGVPDFYQGTELWNLSLVDPDNRRPVDYETRISLLSELQKQEARGLRDLAQGLLTCWEDGRVKLFLTYKALHFRREHPELFASGDYIPVDATGPCNQHVCAFARRLDNTWALVAVPRLLARLRSKNQRQPGGGNQQLELPLELPPLEPPLGGTIWSDNFLVLPEQAPDRWRNILTGETVTVVAKDGSKALSLTDVFQHLPVALLAGD